MLNRIKKITAIVCAAVIVMLAFPVNITADSVSPNNWMSGIADDTLLNNITIPGTHDSGTKNIAAKWTQIKEKILKPWAVTQDEDIRGQLDNGIRLLDIRISLNHDEPGVYHGSGFWSCFCNMTPREAIESVYEFLQDNPSETVIVTLKNEDGKTMSSTYRSAMEEWFDFMRENPSIFYTEDRIPTLGEVRGKIVIYNRFYECALDIGIHYKNRSTVEDSYETTTDNKISCIEASLVNIENGVNDPSKITVTYTSTNPITNFSCLSKYESYSWYELLLNCDEIAGVAAEHLGDCKIRISSSEINNYLMNRNLDKADCYGWFYMDFPSSSLIEKIYNVNFQ